MIAKHSFLKFIFLTYKYLLKMLYRLIHHHSFGLFLFILKAPNHEFFYWQ